MAINETATQRLVQTQAQIKGVEAKLQRNDEDLVVALVDRRDTTQLKAERAQLEDQLADLRKQLPVLEKRALREQLRELYAAREAAFARQQLQSAVITAKRRAMEAAQVGFAEAQREWDRARNQGSGVYEADLAIRRFEQKYPQIKLEEGT
ncbi:MAG TPA: hypothetical protein VGX91_07670 [Candidatus Cybelea sp.]|nr:hypothetical protein [Candidatus Cybelea sp.]